MWLSFYFLLHRVLLLQVQVSPLVVEHTFQIFHEVLFLIHTNHRLDCFLNVPKLQLSLLLLVFVRLHFQVPSILRAF